MIDWKHPDYSAIYQERSERLARLRDDKSLIPAIKEHYKTHPVDFINDWGMTFDPRNVEIGLPAVVPFVLFPRQVDFIEWLRDRWLGREDGLAEKSRDMGLSWLCVAFAVWMWLFHSGTVIGFGSRKEEYVDDLSDPKSLFWKARQFIGYLPEEFKPAGWNERKHAPFMAIGNPENGSAIVGEAGDNIGRGNRTSIYFKDESAYYERPEAIDAALSQTSNCKIDVSTANGTGNPFYKKRHGGRIKVFTFNWRDDPRKGQDWYEKQKRELDPVILAQEVDIDYAAAVSNSFIPGDLVDTAMRLGPADVEAVGPLQYGLDVARFGDDKCVLTCRRGRVLLWQESWGKLDTEDTTGRAKTLIDANGVPDQIAVDVIGVGAGVCDKLSRLYPGKVVAVNSAIRVNDGVNYNLRAQIWANMLDWLKNQPASLPNDPEIKSELCALRYKYQGGLRLIESKDEAKKRGIKSPDRADSLALTFAVPAFISSDETYSHPSDGGWMG